MSDATILDRLIPISTLNHGGASRTINDLRDNQPAVILKNNQPAAVLLTPADYKYLVEQAEEYRLYLLTMDRVDHDDGQRLTTEQVFGDDYEPVDDGYEPEFE
ncbi:type II toxin-antitoxin system Phd/YefM family antitoxin [Bifidobacterium cuniculi]|uniref:Prevent-host-death family protein n=1 Tax=Bifidobacterium cuniculi TaxID=1688 RepID=A0A087AII3_9BIFI|nr:type II toxin-antitoxin system Phd/YefM family antitoxin [Bifidobacterium cuniculi]KFI58583.1 prevent-host-death family protein [Bifidobacterium cuniculi]